VQIIAAVESGGSAALQFSQVGLSSSMLAFCGVRENSTELTPNPLPMPEEKVIFPTANNVQNDATRGRAGKLQRGFEAQPFDHRNHQQPDGCQRQSQD